MLTGHLEGPIRLGPRHDQCALIGKLEIAGNVEFAQILAGFSALNVLTNSDAQIGSVKVGGDWIASDLSASIQTGAGNHFGFVAQQIGAFKLAGEVLELSATAVDVVEVAATNDVTVREVQAHGRYFGGVSR